MNKLELKFNNHIVSKNEYLLTKEQISLLYKFYVIYSIEQKNSAKSLLFSDYG